MLRQQWVWLKSLSPAQVVSGYYVMAVIISIILFSLPGVHKPGANVSFFHTVFMSVSIVSDTGLSIFNVADTYSVFGYFVIMLVLQFGGIGIMAISTLFWLLLGRKISLRERRLIMVDNNQFALAGLVKLVKDVVKIFLITELLGALILGIRFIQYYPTWREAFLHGLFASVSATTNAGLDITGLSMTPFAGDYFVQLVTIVLIIFGAIGFPVLLEAKAFLSHERGLGKLPYRFSLFTKLTVSTYGILLAAGTLLILLFEHNNYFSGMSWHQSFFYALFQAATTRSAGVTTLDINQLALPTLLLMSVYMFIGGSPNSVGGGIRTTTFALNMLFLYSFAKGKPQIKVFNREVHPDDILKSLAITMLALVLCCVSVMAISFTDRQHSPVAIFLEVCSAFGTVGLSTGITPDLSPFAQCILMVLMFLGRIGLTSVLNLMGGNKKNPLYRYPVERVMTG
ncbi:TrkH family potassium uptake protein [Paenibacillus oryzisoli]|uniref:TrkH family potassium uptake protein n=1 Tax=Paenibacillus oryzisoli TaxID=1850517 RepID=UPI003D29D447